MLNKIRYLLYASGTYIKDATQKSIVIVKTFVEEIKTRGIKEIFKEEWMFHQKRIVSAALIILFIIVGIIAGIITNKVIDDEITYTNGTETVQEEETILLDVKLGADTYMVKRKSGVSTLYINGEKKKNIAYDQLPMLYFNMNASESSDEILKMADADHIENTGGQVYRGKRMYVERYYQYLLENGYENQTYITTGSYMDAYFTKNEETYRFLYIKKTDDTGVLVFGSCDNKMPDSIDKILKDN